LTPAEQKPSSERKKDQGGVPEVPRSIHHALEMKGLSSAHTMDREFQAPDERDMAPALFADVFQARSPTAPKKGG